MDLEKFAIEYGAPESLFVGVDLDSLRFLGDRLCQIRGDRQMSDWYSAAEICAWADVHSHSGPREEESKEAFADRVSRYVAIRAWAAAQAVMLFESEVKRDLRGVVRFAAEEPTACPAVELAYEVPEGAAR